MKIKPIRSKADYEAALKEIDNLLESQPGTPEGDRFDVLVALVETYEAKNFPIPEPNDPVKIMKYYMESRGLSRSDMIAFIHSSQFPRQGWAASFTAMANLGADQLLDQTLSTQWDEDEWTW
jgi:antitoxin component HigA of HigAB toxin-antitoxin module